MTIRPLAEVLPAGTGGVRAVDALDGRPLFLRFGPGPVVDLPGHGLLPTFTDDHCHILPTGLDLQKLHLGDAEDHAAVLDRLRDRHRSHREGWLLAVHYDQTRYPEGHLHRDDLDAISPDRPILLRHSNGHASVANSAALAAAGVAEDVEDPPGGTFVRGPDGRLTGVLLEDAHEHVTNAVPMPTVEEMVAAILAAGELMRGFGIGAASDLMTGRYDLLREIEAYRLAAERGNPVRVRLFLQWATVFGPRAAGADALREALAGLDGVQVRAEGIKLFADGAIGSATAAIYGRYTDAAPNGAIVSPYARPAQHPDREVSGQLIYRPERLRERVLVAANAGWRVVTHAIGDYATDLVMDAYEATGEPSRHRIEHVMLLSDAQIERLAALGCAVSVQPEFLMRFGHAYLRQLGPERTRGLKRIRSLLDAGVPVSFSSDRPIVPGDPRDAIQTAIGRPPIFDPGENITLNEALRAHTVSGERANGDPVPSLADLPPEAILCQALAPRDDR